MKPSQVKARDDAQLERWLREPETILADIVAAQTPKRRCSDPLPVYVLVAMQKGRERWARKKAQAAVWRNQLRRREWNKANHPSVVNQGTGGVPARIVRAMAPGGWYGIKALARSIGYPVGAIGLVRMKLIKRKWIEGAVNPAWDPNAWRDGAKREPKWLYRLTSVGETARAKFNNL